MFPHRGPSVPALWAPKQHVGSDTGSALTVSLIPYCFDGCQMKQAVDLLPTEALMRKGDYDRTASIWNPVVRGETFLDERAASSFFWDLCLSWLSFYSSYERQTAWQLSHVFSKICGNHLIRTERLGLLLLGWFFREHVGRWNLKSAHRPCRQGLQGLQLLNNREHCDHDTGPYNAFGKLCYYDSSWKYVIYGKTVRVFWEVS